MNFFCFFMKLLFRKNYLQQKPVETGYFAAILSLFFLVNLICTERAEAQTYSLNSTLNGTTINTCSGTFYGSGGSGANYQNNENNSITFCSSTSGKALQMAFTSFSTESGYDFLEIFDGASTSSTSLGKFSGTSSPGTITGSGTCLTAKFTSDNSNVSAGWAATLTCATRGVIAGCTNFSVLVVNYGANTLNRFDDSSGNFLGTLATSTQGLDAPNFMYQLPNGQLLVSNGNGNNIVKLNPYTGAALGSFGSGLNFPEQIKLGPNGYLYLANQGAANLKVYDTNGNLISTLTDSRITAPNGIGFDKLSNMYISNNQTGGSIYKYTTNGSTLNYVSILKTYPLSETPRGIAMLGNDLYVNVITANGARVEKFTNSTGTPSTFVTLPTGANPYAGIVWGPDGRLYIANYGQNQVNIYDADGSTYRTLTSNLNGPHGVAFSGCSPLKVNPLVVTTVCGSATGSITANAAGGITPYTYNWSTGATTASVSGLAYGTYSVTVTDWNNVTATSSVLVNCTCPTLSNPSAAQSVCVGAAGSNITVNTTINSANSIKFIKFTTEQIAGATPTAAEAATIYAGPVFATVTPTGSSSPYTGTYNYNAADFPNASASTIIYYVYAVLNPDGGTSCRPIQEIKITVNPVVSISSQPTGITECLTGTQSLNVTATGGYPLLSYQWQKSSDGGTTWTSISGATANSYTPPSSTTGTVQYRITVASNGGTGCNSATSNAVTVTIVSPPIVSITASSASICTGSNIFFSASPTVTAGACSVQWQSSPDGTTWSNISGASGNSYSTSLTTASTSKHFRAQLVSCTGSGCCN